MVETMTWTKSSRMRVSASAGEGVQIVPRGLCSMHTYGGELRELQRVRASSIIKRV